MQGEHHSLLDRSLQPFCGQVPKLLCGPDIARRQRLTVRRFKASTVVPTTASAASLRSRTAPQQRRSLTGASS
jgi:hypothetical protein